MRERSRVLLLIVIMGAVTLSTSALTFFTLYVELGTVAGIDPGAIRPSLTRAAFIETVVAVFLIILGTVLFFRISRPMIKEHERAARELAIRNGIAQAFLTAPDEELYSRVLTIVLEAMRSRYGIFGYIDENGDLAVPTMTRDIWDECKIPDKTVIIPQSRWRGTLPNALRTQKTICRNEPSRATPQGHIPITRHLSTPIIHQGKSIGLLQVANKGSDYTTEDISLLETLGGAIAPILDARLKVDARTRALEAEIEERKKIEKALQAHRDNLEMRIAQRSAELKRSNQDLEQFAWVASHDLQEPLNMISSYTRLLQDQCKGRVDEQAEISIRFAAEGAERLQKMIRDLLDYARVEIKGKALEPTDLSDVLAEALANLKSAIDAAQVKVSSGPLPTVRADRSQLVRLFQNLIGNAIKFRGPNPLRVRISAEPADAGKWKIAVQDNGIGIDPAQKDRIFVIFQRLHGQKAYPGTGLGLALCKRIVERHGGEIWVESRPGEGATFYFTLPE